MSKYIIAFTDFMHKDREYYKGGSYMYGNEKYASFGRGREEAKRYASKKIAERSARKLSEGNCVNTDQDYEIIEVEE